MQAAPSFLRVGHLELFSRRAKGGVPGGIEGLERLCRHALKREFDEVDATLPLCSQLVCAARIFARRQAHTVAQWLRVGYIQGNMNSDNCLLSGRTMDYGTCCPRPELIVHSAELHRGAQGRSASWSDTILSGILSFRIPNASMALNVSPALRRYQAAHTSG